MALPSYDKSKRKAPFEMLPKGAYVIRIMGAKEENNKNSSGSHLTIIFDIAEGEYKGFYGDLFEKNTNEDKKWPADATYYLSVPEAGSPQWMLDGWNTFFADLEDSNNGYVFAGNPKELKNKLIGGKFAIEQTEYQGKVYDHTRLRWTCVADAVRNGKTGRMPNDKLLSGKKTAAAASDSGPQEWMNVPDSSEEELPF